MVMVNHEIRAARERGDVVIEPYSPAAVNNASVDVHLGAWVAWPTGDDRLNRDRDDDVWGFDLESSESSNVFHISNILTQTGRDVILKPGERILAHTHEFIGSRRAAVPEMRAKSTFARWGLTVCACAGWGDVGYFGRWTLEILNLNKRQHMRLKYGMPIGQVVFHPAAEPEAGTLYGEKGNYQGGQDLAAMMCDWRPSMMLPKNLRPAAHVEPLPCDEAPERGLAR